MHGKIRAAAEALKPRAVDLLRELVRIPSENHPPHGGELAVQEFYQCWLSERGVESSLRFPVEIPGFTAHPARLAEHDMAGRPNVVAKLPGTGGGRSLLVLAHADVVPIGPREAWDGAPFGGEVRGGLLYGRGAGDDKCGMAIAAMIPLALRAAGVELAGDLTIAAVADEEAGGGNGTAALFADGVRADAAVYLDGSNQTIWNAGLGGGFAYLTLPSGADPRWAREIIMALKEERKQAIVGHRAFGAAFFEQSMQDFFSIAQNGNGLTFFLDTLPGEDEGALRRQAEAALRPAGTIRWMSRFLKPSDALADDHPLVATLSDAFQAATGRRPRVGPGRQSDQGLVSHFGGVPCVLFGCGRLGRDGSPHRPNECVSLEEFGENLVAAVLMAAAWCGARHPHCGGTFQQQVTQPLARCLP